MILGCTVFHSEHLAVNSNQRSYFRMVINIFMSLPLSRIETTNFKKSVYSQFYFFNAYKTYILSDLSSLK